MTVPLDEIRELRHLNFSLFRDNERLTKANTDLQERLTESIKLGNEYREELEYSKRIAKSNSQDEAAFKAVQDERDQLREELAQVTLRSELAETRYEIIEIEKEAMAGINGDLERADAALQRIETLSKNFLSQYPKQEETK